MVSNSRRLAWISGINFDFKKALVYDLKVLSAAIAIAALSDDAVLDL
jgi:hypothetical protein